MAEILQYVRPEYARPGQSLGPETLIILGAAYDRAIAALHSGTMSESVCEGVASRIIDAGIRGERDPDMLHELALRGV